MEVKKMVEKWEIWNEKEKVAKSEEEDIKLVPQKFHKWIHIFEKKVSERMLMKKLWDYMIEVKNEFMPRKGKFYLLLREERKEIHKFIKEQLRKRYIRPLKSPQTALVFFVGKNSKKRMIQDY